jgi:hypothetical protein
MVSVIPNLTDYLEAKASALPIALSVSGAAPPSDLLVTEIVVRSEKDPTRQKRIYKGSPAPLLDVMGAFDFTLQNQAAAVSKSFHAWHGLQIEITYNNGLTSYNCQLIWGLQNEDRQAHVMYWQVPSQYGNIWKALRDKAGWTSPCYPLEQVVEGQMHKEEAATVQRRPRSEGLALREWADGAVPWDFDGTVVTSPSDINIGALNGGWTKHLLGFELGGSEYNLAREFADVDTKMVGGAPPEGMSKIQEILALWWGEGEIDPDSGAKGYLGPGSGVEFTPVVYPVGSEVITDGGNTGKFKILAAGWGIPVLPDIPSFEELTFKPNPWTQAFAGDVGFDHIWCITRVYVENKPG